MKPETRIFHALLCYAAALAGWSLVLAQVACNQPVLQTSDLSHDGEGIVIVAPQDGGG